MSGALAAVPALLAAALAVGFAFWSYLYREPPVRGRAILATLRAASLVLLVLLFWNPAVAMLGSPVESAAPDVLLDASVSMGAGAGGERPWDEARERVTGLAGPGGTVLLFGGSPRLVPVDSLDDLEPSEEASSLAPALRRAAELGSRTVQVVSDFRIEDPAAVSDVLESAGLGVRSVDVGADVPDAGIVEIAGPGSLQAGEEGRLEVVLATAGRAGSDSADLELRVEDRLLTAARIALPTEGRTTRRLLEFQAPDREGEHWLAVRVVMDGDAFAADDERLHHLRVREGGAGLVYLALRPDWEARYLLPVLEQVTGMEGRGFLLLGDGRWISMGQGEGVGVPVGVDRVRTMVGDARMLVLQGWSPGNPAWLDEASAAVPRRIVLPRDEEGAAALGLDVDPPREGEWYVSPEIPTSPLAGELAGVSFEGLPPLTRHLRLVSSVPSVREPVLARQGRQGPLEPVLVLVPGADGRTVVALATGFWRWAARDGAARAAYRRLWSGVAGWLLAEEGSGPRVAVEPAVRPSPSGEPVTWDVRGDAGDSLGVRIVAGEADSVVVDTTVATAGGAARTAALPPGAYRYRVEAPGLEDGPADGVLRISGYAGDLLHPRIEPPGASGERLRAGAAAGPGRPLRTHPVPYLLLIALLAAEWIGRRRQGLR